MSWQLWALDAWLRLNEKPRLARERSVAAARARMEATAARAFPLPAGALAGGAPARRPAARRLAPAGPGGRGRPALAARRRLLPRLAAHPRRHGRRRWRGGRGRARCCPTTASRPSTSSPPPSRTPSPPGRRSAPRAWPPGRIALGGDSAGGGLAFALLHLLLAAGAPPPACVVAFSPWADLTLAGASLRRLAWRDAFLPGAAPRRDPRPVPRRRRPARPARLAAPRPLRAARRPCSSRPAAPRSCSTTPALMAARLARRRRAR